jgi:hypothetical protein
LAVLEQPTRHGLACSCSGSRLGVDCSHWTVLVWPLTDESPLCAFGGVCVFDPRRAAVA